MSVIDVDKLLQELPDSPCGDDLEYDPAFGELERASQGKPEQQMGDTIVPAEEPDWRAMKSKALELFDRTRDLRVGVYLAQALLRTDGYQGFSDGLAVVRGLIETHWEGVHPLLDPDDDNDPTFRVNTIVDLCNPEAGFAPGSTLRGVRDAPLVSSKIVGRFGLTDVQVADGTLPATEGEEEAPQMSVIEAAFMDVDLEVLQETGAAIDGAVECIQAIDTSLTEKVGAAQAADLSALTTLLKAAQKVLAAQLSRRGVASSTSDEETAEGEPGAAGAPPAAAAQISGDISTRQDAIRMLDKVCEYFNRYEPSSPVPLLLQRSKRLVTKSFMEIMRDLAPAGLTQVQSLTGPDAPGESAPEEQA